PVDAGRAYHRSGQTVAEVLEGELLAAELRLLVVITRRERRVLSGRRVLDLALHADGRAVQEPPHAGSPGRLEQMSGPLHVDPPELVGVAMLRAERGGDVIDGVDPRE